MVRHELAEMIGNPDDIIEGGHYPRLEDRCDAVGNSVLLSVYAYYPTPSGTVREMKELMLSGDARPLSIMTVADIADWGYRAVSQCGIDEARIVSLQVEKFYSTKPRIELVVYEYEGIEHSEG